jgi:hypothetical protein
MALPKSAYANLALFAAPRPASIVERKAAANDERAAESRLKYKVEQANRLLEALEKRTAEYAAEIKTFQRLKAVTCARIARLEDEIIRRMDAAGLKSVNGVRCAMRLQTAAEALEIVDESLIPRAYFNTPKVPPATPDKVAIKRALAALEDADPAAWGCRLSSKISLIRS